MDHEAHYVRRARGSSGGKAGGSLQGILHLPYADVSGSPNLACDAIDYSTLSVYREGANARLLSG
jgi:hypothetical protein